MRKILPRVSSWLAAIVMGQTLFYKFSGAEESKALFETMGMEPWGRIGVGIVELIAVVLLVINRTKGIGGILGVGLMGGAVFAHVTSLGIEIMGDGGYLFWLAVTALVGSIVPVITDYRLWLADIKSLLGIK